MASYTKKTVDVQGSPMDCLIFEPEGAGPYPGFVVTQHIPIAHAGLEKDPFTIDIGERLNKAGYAAIIPYIFHWWDPEEELQVKRDEWRDDRLLADLDTSYEILCGLDSVDQNRIGIMGHCWGGRMAWLGAGRNPNYKVAGVLYGGRIKLPMGEGSVPPIDLAGNMKCAMIGVFGNNDQNPSPEDVKDLDAALNAAGIEHEFHCYDDAGHGFQDFCDDNRYCKEQSDDAWNKLITFFDAKM